MTGFLLLLLAFFPLLFLLTCRCLGLGGDRRTAASLPRDLRLLSEKSGGTGAEQHRREEYGRHRKTVADVRRYYRSTTFLDYLILRVVYGSEAMHTVLRCRHGDASPLMHVVSELGAARDSVRSLYGTNAYEHKKRSRVLELGSGKGANSLLLGSVFPDLEVHAVDVTDVHCAHARDRVCRLGLQDSVHIHAGDVADPSSCSATLNAPDAKASFGLVFGIESLCHLDSEDRRDSMLRFVSGLLTRGTGKLVVADGFRSGRFSALPSCAQRAMELSEAAFCINAMPSMDDWVRACARHGLVLERCVDLAEEAARFWETWGDRANGLLRVLPGPVLRVVRRVVPYSFGNFVAACMVGHALRSGAADYGVMIFRRVAHD